MKILSGYKASKAIKLLLENPSGSAESNEAISRLKQIGEPAIPRLIEALQETQPNSQIEFLLLSLLKNKTLPYYIEGLTAVDKKVVAATMRILASPNRYDANRLLELFDDPEISNNVLIQILLAHKKTLRMQTLLSMLGRVEKNSRLLVLKIIDEIANETHVDDLLNYIDSDDLTIRFHIIKNLAKFDTVIVRDTLLTFLNDENKNIRQIALDGLANLKTAVPCEPICQLLKDPDITVQSKAIDALVKINDPDIITHLIEILQDESEYVRRASVEVLNEIGDKRAIKDLLIAIRDKDWWVKVRAADALGAIGGPRVVEAVLFLIKDKDDFLRRTAVEILNSIQDVRAVDHLVKALKDKDWWVRERAADALGHLGDKRACPALLDMVEKIPASANAAIQALAKIDDKTTINPLLDMLSPSQDSLNIEILTTLQELTDKEHLTRVKEVLKKFSTNTDEKTKAFTEEILNSIVGRVEYDADEMSSVLNEETISTEKQLSDKIVPVDEPTSVTTESIDASKLTPGYIIANRYKVIRQVGKGAFGIVILVNDTMINENIILKFLNAQMASDENVIQRFIHELRFARKITHSNVIRIYDFITFGHSYAISMEYFPSHSLAYEIRSKRKIERNRIVKIFSQICQAIHVAHQADVIHRDLKPANILIGKNDLVKVVDFGLAAAASQSDPRLTKSGVLVGTPTYIAPEQIRARAIDARTDIYSLGIVLYEIFTGKAPYKGEDHMATLFKHVEGKADAANKVNPEIDPALNTIIMKAMAKNPQKRYQSITELQNDLETLLE